MVHYVSADAVEALLAHSERKSGAIGLIRSRLPRQQVVGRLVLHRQRAKLAVGNRLLIHMSSPPFYIDLLTVLPDVQAARDNQPTGEMTH